MDKKIALRFDVDTHKCIREGVPALIDLASELDVRFTFYVNFGRSISIIDSLRQSIHSHTSSLEEQVKLSALKKLGLGDYLIALFLNPPIHRYKGQITRLFESAHEVGLHGGRNHQKWTNRSKYWNEDNLLDEIQWGMKWFEKFSKRGGPLGFSSPSWEHPDKLMKILETLDFDYCADTRNSEQVVTRDANKVLKVSTSLCGEPGGVATFENIFAQRLQAAPEIATLSNQIRSTGKPMVVYDHPYFAGCEGLLMVRQLIDTLKPEGYEFVTVSDLCKQ